MAYLFEMDMNSLSRMKLSDKPLIAPFQYTIDPERIPSRKIVDIRPERKNQILYACPDACWRDHNKGWSREWDRGNRFAPMPMPPGHVIFDNPEAHGCVPFGDNTFESRRRALEGSTRSELSGWDRDIDPEVLEGIVKETVEAKIRGVNTGVAPFLKCLGLGLS
jgi:hypothetical protein